MEDLDAWRASDRETLAAQYNARAAVPEHPAIFARWRARSASARAAALADGSARLGLRYGSHPRERFDLFLPTAADATASRLHLFLHGGYWQAMGRMDFGFLAAAPVAAGQAFAVLGYPLCPDVSFGELVDAVERGYDKLLATAPDHGIEPANPVITGHSAGGHLAVLLAQALTARGATRSALPGRIHAVSGVFDLEPLVHTPLNVALGLDAATARAHSPARRTPVPGVPVTAWVGAHESAEFHRQARTFAARWHEAGAAAEYRAVPGCNHFTVIERLLGPGGGGVADSPG
jgi:arylformamidase